MTKKHKITLAVSVGSVILLGAAGGFTAWKIHNYNLYDAPGWHSIDGVSYYIGEDGARLYGLQELTSPGTADSAHYYFDAQGEMYTGWLEEDGVRYYFSENGQLLCGESEVDGETYALDAETGALITGWQEGRYLDQYGFPVSGWMTENDATYYLSVDGVPATGQQKIDGAYYYFDENGRMQTGLITLTGGTYGYGADGKRLAGLQVIGSYQYYLDDSGKVQTGICGIGGKKYFFNQDGIMLSGWQEEDGQSYYFGADGAMQDGWVIVDELTYYFDELGQRKYGYAEIDGGTYYFDENGVLCTGFQTIDGNLYCFGADGRIVQGYYDYNGTSLYFNSVGALANGWLYLSDGTFYFRNGVKLTGTQVINGATYYLLDDGRLLTGWCTVEKGRIYKNKYGANLTGWQTLGGRLYHFDETTGLLSVSTTIGSYIIDAQGVATKAPVTIETLPKEADAILAKTGKDLYNIYRYVDDYISYKFMPQESVEAMAVYALNNRKGACYHYAALLYYLLNRAGYEVIIINGTGHNDGPHYWNMVCVDGTWYHLDACNSYYLVSGEYLKERNYTWEEDAFPVG